MENFFHPTEEILNECINGFHQYLLSNPVHLNYVSNHLCTMTGFSKKELLNKNTDSYATLVYPADREMYSQMIKQLQTKAQTLTAEYRLVKKDGTILYVRDTVTSKQLDNGSLAAYSVLTDITDLKKENTNLQFLNETIPCGFLKYTCEKQPKITYINEKMLELLRFPKEREGEINYLELYKDNIFFLIPMEERRRFSKYLNRVYTANAPIAGETTLLRCDGTRAHVFGWVIKTVNDDGQEEFQSVCMDMTEEYHARKFKETKHYLKALSDVFDNVFEYNFHTNTVKCLYSNDSPIFRRLENIPMQMEDATEKWIAATVAEEEQNSVRLFFRDFIQKKLYQPNEKPPQITYRALSSDGQTKSYTGIFLKLEENVSLYCCRCVLDIQETDHLRAENISLKQELQNLVLQFTEGIAAFEVTEQEVTPLYASDNVCEFFGISKEEWFSLMKKSTPIKDFVSRSKVAYDNFTKLLQMGEAEFSYFDLSTQTNRRIKAICSRKSPVGSTPRYIMLYNMDEPEKNTTKQTIENHLVSIRTFGYFDVFVDNRPIAFRSQKAKELFALLVDRRGGYVSSEEAISFLWEEETVNPVTLARYRKVALRLKNILEEYDISEVIESVDGKRRIVTEKVQCDLYDYLTGKEEFSHLFHYSYLNNYSWGETTLGELSRKRTST